MPARFSNGVQFETLPDKWEQLPFRKAQLNNAQTAEMELFYINNCSLTEEDKDQFRQIPTMTKEDRGSTIPIRKIAKYFGEENQRKKILQNLTHEYWKRKHKVLEVGGCIEKDKTAPMFHDQMRQFVASPFPRGMAMEKYLERREVVVVQRLMKLSFLNAVVEGSGKPRQQSVGHRQPRTAQDTKLRASSRCSAGHSARPPSAGGSAVGQAAPLATAPPQASRASRRAPSAVPSGAAPPQA